MREPDGVPDRPRFAPIRFRRVPLPSGPSVKRNVNLAPLRLTVTLGYKRRVILLFIVYWLLLLFNPT